MALPLNTHQITGVFAFGQWFTVEEGSFYIDAFSLRQWDADPDDKVDQWSTSFTDYEMGELYRSVAPEYSSNQYGPNSRGRFQTPSQHDGCCFKDSKTGERVSFSLLEVRAFRENPKVNKRDA